jgi:Sec23/Sec24 trunk domain
MSDLSNVVLRFLGVTLLCLCSCELSVEKVHCWCFLHCSQILVPLQAINASGCESSSEFTDLASLAALPKYTCGQLYFYPGFNPHRDEQKLSHELSRNLSRTTGAYRKITILSFKAFCNWHVFNHLVCCLTHGLQFVLGHLGHSPLSSGAWSPGLVPHRWGIHDN